MGACPCITDGCDHPHGRCRRRADALVRMWSPILGRWKTFKFCGSCAEHARHAWGLAGALMLGFLLRRGRNRAGEVCPACGRYDWPDQPVIPDSCRSGLHLVKTCPCGYQRIRFDCEDHG